MAETMNVVVKEIVIHNNAKQIYVANGMIYNIVGEGSTACAQLTFIDEATEVELYNALGPSDVERWPLAASLGQMADFTMVGEDEKYLLRLPVKNNVKIIAAEEATVAEDTLNPGDSLDKEEVYSFDDAVNFLCQRSGEDFLELIKYAKSHRNRFPKTIKEIAHIINADDAYCIAIIKLSRPLGAIVEKRAFEIFETAVTNDEISRDYFNKFWRALQIINNFC